MAKRNVQQARQARNEQERSWSVADEIEKLGRLK
jgi:hypothetical protein